ncbi:MAG: hypothetical protein JNJ40_15535 [Bacteroidia bacterium]|nr:hypothetical protein [Bacteroidia bacterium]
MRGKLIITFFVAVLSGCVKERVCSCSDGTTGGGYGYNTTRRKLKKECAKVEKELKATYPNITCEPK